MIALIDNYTLVCNRDYLKIGVGNDSMNLLGPDPDQMSRLEYSEFLTNLVRFIHVKNHTPGI